ncbi:hypothetical protein [Nonomuraea bangladeshensis]|uniref:hypothetical protein n=1 Tax=Nonomuraea bangladeshensis TaxID=404385 RepID=UPI003C2B6429
MTSYDPSHDTPPLDVEPDACDEVGAALEKYRQSAASTRSRQAAAARQAHLNLERAADDATGAVKSTITRLAIEFQELSFRLAGTTNGDPNQVITDIRADLAKLRKLCGYT